MGSESRHILTINFFIMVIIKHMEQRVAVFIDTQNLYHTAKNLYNARVDFKSVVKTVVGKRKLIRALAYVVRTETGEETGFFEALEKAEIEPKVKDLQIFNSNTKKGDWDVGIAVDMINYASKVDSIILISGDGDFIPALEYVRLHGCQIEISTFGKSCSGRLREMCDEFTDLSDAPTKHLIRTRN